MHPRFRQVPPKRSASTTAIRHPANLSACSVFPLPAPTITRSYLSVATCIKVPCRWTAQQTVLTGRSHFMIVGRNDQIMVTATHDHEADPAVTHAGGVAGWWRA